MQNRQSNEEVLHSIAKRVSVYSSLKDVVNFTSINKSLHERNDNKAWQEKFKIHFPHLYKTLDPSPDFNWRSKFDDAYKTEYHKLPKNIKKLFSLIKEKKLYPLRKISFKANDLHYRDSNGIPLWQWAKETNNQQLLNYIFAQLMKEYSAPGIFRQIFQKHSPSSLDIKKMDRVGSTILHWAIRLNQSKELIHTLIWQGFDITAALNDFTNKSEEETVHLSPIHIACRQGNLDVVKLLIETQPSLINSVDNFGQTPILWAASRGHTTVVKYLAKKHAHIINQTCRLSGGGLNPLHWATQIGSLETVQALIDNRAILKYPTILNTRKQAIHIACEYGHLDILKLLINKDGTLINERDRFGKTPLLYAIKKGHVDIVRYLVEEKNAIPTLPIPTEYIHAACSEGHLEIVKFFINKAPSIINAADIDGFTPIALAAKHGRTSVVNYLANLGANVNQACNDRLRKNFCFTPLHWASENGNTKSIQILLNHGAKPTSKSLDGKTPRKVAPRNSLITKELKLYEFLATLSTKSENSYRHSFSFFGHQFHFGNSVKVEKDAALAMKDVFEGKTGLESLEPHKKVIESCELKSIRKGLGI